MCGRFISAAVIGLLWLAAAGIIACGCWNTFAAACVEVGRGAQKSADVEYKFTAA